jgi:hypothetical protein
VIYLAITTLVVSVVNFLGLLLVLAGMGTLHSRFDHMKITVTLPFATPEDDD